MFLTSANEIITWIEQNPEAAKTFTTIIGPVFSLVGGFLGWIFHGIKYNRDKRLDAKTTVYPIIHRSIGQLRTALDEHNRLHIPDTYNADSDVGNIYVLLYLKTDRNNYCGSYHEIDQNELQKYKKLAIDVKTSLNNFTNSIHPFAIRKKTWQESKEILTNFCDFLTNMEDDYLGEIGKLRKTPESEPMHIEKCKELIWAMDNLYNATK